MEKVINCSILTPENLLFDGEVEYAIVNAHDGEMGFLPNHAALVSALGIGELRLKKDNAEHYFIVEGGVVEMRDNKLIVLAESAFLKSDLKKDILEAKLKEIQDSIDSSENKAILKLEEKKLKARLKVALK